jgi:peroxiredoxin
VSLQEKLAAFTAQFQSGKPPFDGVPPAVHDLMKRGKEDLIASGAAARVIKTGVAAPMFELKDAEGKAISLADLLTNGPVALSFYRGAWCPYCNLDLQELELYASKIKALGATLVTITPQLAVNSRKLIADHKLSFIVLSDPGNAVAEQYGLRYRLPDYLVELYKQLGVDLPMFNGDSSWTLPTPGRFIIDRQRVIRYAEANPDYTQRPEPDVLLPVLEKLKSGN